MDKTITKIFLITLVFSAHLAFALPNPAPYFCREMGYETINESCVFPDGRRCEQWAFYRGECGQEHVKNLVCTELGEAQLPGHECCEGLTPITRAADTDRGCAIPVGAWPVCAACGDGVCDGDLENKCNCPKDCGRCIGEGGKGISVGTNPDECCGGLTKIGNSFEEDGGCVAPTDGSFRCTYCGDGICAEGENTCNCPSDCINESDEDYTRCSSDGDCEAFFYHCSCAWRCGKTNQHRIDCMNICPNEPINRQLPECVCENNECRLKTTFEDECGSKEDCEPFFSHCSCSWTCVEKSDEPRADCRRMCPNEEGALSEKPSCTCEDGKCQVSQVDSEPVCDATKPCPNGLTCMSFPGEGLKCAKENPCSYYECPKDSECIVAESVPPKVYCTKPTPDTGEQQTVSYDVHTEKVTVSSSQGEVEVSIQSIKGNRGLIKTKKAEATSSKPLSIHEKIIVMETSSGKKEPVKLLPEDAVNVVSAKGKDEVSEIMLAQAKEKPVYNMVLAKKTKLLGLIPVNMQYEASVDAQSGEKISVKKPWWHILTFELFNNKGNPQTGLEEARVIAGDRVVSDYNFRNLGGYNLGLKETPQSCGENCFRFTYEYRINESRITGVEKIQAIVTVVDGDTRNFSYTEVRGEVNSFRECVEAGYEVLEPDCVGCQPYCTTPSGEKLQKPSENVEGFCENKCGNGVCDEIVCMAQGCPCPENPQNCQKDCLITHTLG